MPVTASVRVARVCAVAVTGIVDRREESNQYSEVHRSTTSLGVSRHDHLINVSFSVLLLDQDPCQCN